jgi:hypothetical protein
VKAVRRLEFDRPHRVCTAGYYNRVRPDLQKANGLLGAQLLYAPRD